MSSSWDPEGPGLNRQEIMFLRMLRSRFGGAPDVSVDPSLKVGGTIRRGAPGTLASILLGRGRPVGVESTAFTGESFNGRLQQSDSSYALAHEVAHVLDPRSSGRSDPNWDKLYRMSESYGPRGEGVDAPHEYVADDVSMSLLGLLSGAPPSSMDDRIRRAVVDSTASAIFSQRKRRGR